MIAANSIMVLLSLEFGGNGFIIRVDLPYVVSIRVHGFRMNFRGSR